MFPSIQICKEVPRHNAFGMIIEKIKSITELPSAKKNPVNSFCRLLNDIRNNFNREGLGWKSHKVLFTGNKFISRASKDIFYTEPRQD